MVAQKSPGVTGCAGFRQDDGQTFEKIVTVAGIQKYLSTLYPADHDVMQYAGSI